MCIAVQGKLAEKSIFALKVVSLFVLNSVDAHMVVNEAGREAHFMRMER